MKNDVSVFEKYGGYKTISVIVHSFYKDLLQSKTLAPYFKGKSIEAIIGHQIEFFCDALGGSEVYNGPSIKESHKGLKITEEVFYEAIGLLEKSLEKS